MDVILHMVMFQVLISNSLFTLKKDVERYITVLCIFLYLVITILDQPQN